jgi:exosome complex component CSL4
MNPALPSPVASLMARPGQPIGSASEYLPGPGTHIYKGHIYASILGPATKSTPAKPAGPQKRLTKITPVASTALPTLSIERSVSSVNPPRAAQDGRGNAKGDGKGDGAAVKAEILPEVNSTVLCRVTRIQPRQASVAILVVGETVLDGEWQGLIRVQDVRATEKDKVKIFESFRPGDIVRAVVVRLSSSSLTGRFLINLDTDQRQISLGDQSNYYLSTASNNLGVIMATSEAGNTMYPVSWKEYKDPETGISESRKVAKPF